MRKQFHWRPRKRSEEDGIRNNGNLLGTVNMRRTCLSDGEMRAILMAKGTEKLKKAIEVDHAKAIAK